jgi:isoprenylcysteine carboxyl methyltransferase (ICMT) family protein YpbQ
MSDSKHTVPSFLKQLREPYYIAVIAVLGGITAIFGAVITVLIIVAANCNVLGAIE